MNLSRVAGTAHVYGGLFLTPLVVMFAISVLVINHVPVETPVAEWDVEALKVDIPAGVESLAGHDRIDQLRPVLDALGVRGEVGFVRYLDKEERLVIPVTTPSREWIVDVNLRERSATVKVRKMPPSRGAVYLHKMPGPHLTNIRGNWVVTRIWKILTDVTVYLIFLATVTGILLWWLLRPLRWAGLAWLVAGMATFAGVLYALVF